MFEWVKSIPDRIAKWIYEKGAAGAEREARLAEGRLRTVREVRELVTDAMTHAESSWRGRLANDDRTAPIALSNRAASVVQEVDDDELRRLVDGWKVAYDSTPLDYVDHRREPSEWAGLVAAASEVTERAGVVYRSLATGKKS